MWEEMAFVQAIKVGQNSATIFHKINYCESHGANEHALGLLRLYKHIASNQDRRVEYTSRNQDQPINLG